MRRYPLETPRRLLSENPYCFFPHCWREQNANTELQTSETCCLNLSSCLSCLGIKSQMSIYNFRIIRGTRKENEKSLGAWRIVPLCLCLKYKLN